MAAVLFRVALLAVGLGVVEIALTDVMIGSLGGWLGVLLGLAMVVAGSAGFMVPLFAGRAQEAANDD